MNKLAVLAFTILALLGAALWYIASDSLNFYLKHKIETDGQLITSYPVKVAVANVNNANGIATFKDIQVFDHPEANGKEIGELIFSIEHVALLLDKESLNKAPIIIKELRITPAAFNPILSTDESYEHTNKILAAVAAFKTSHVTKQANSEQQLEPYFLVKKVIFTADEQMHADIGSNSIPKVNVPPTTDKEGIAVSLIAADLLTTLLRETLVK